MDSASPGLRVCVTQARCDADLLDPLCQMLLKEALNAVERNVVVRAAIIEVAMIGTGDDQQFLVICIFAVFYHKLYFHMAYLVSALFPNYSRLIKTVAESVDMGAKIAYAYPEMYLFDTVIF